MQPYLLLQACLLQVLFEKGELMARLYDFAGPAPREVIAQQIASATGPSGPNDEYLFCLARALQEVCRKFRHPASVTCEWKALLLIPKGMRSATQAAVFSYSLDFKAGIESPWAVQPHPNRASAKSKGRTCRFPGPYKASDLHLRL